MLENLTNKKNASPVVKIKKLFSTTGIIPYFLTLTMLVVLFGFVPMKQVRAQTSGTCSNPMFLEQATCESNGGVWTPNDTTTTPPTSTDGSCNISLYKDSVNCVAYGGVWTPNNTTTPPPTTTPPGLQPGEVYCDYGPNADGSPDIGIEESAADCTASGGTVTTTPPSTTPPATPPALQPGEVYCDYGPNADGSPDIGIEESAADCTASGGTVTTTPPSTTPPATPPALQPGEVYCDYGPNADGTPDIGIEESTADCTASGGTVTTTPPSSSEAGTKTTSNNSAFSALVDEYACKALSTDTWLDGCFVHLMYFLLMLIPSFILWLSAYFFNVFIAVSLSSKLFAGSTFIPTAWAVVRDLSNIFFILVLLYIAIRLILGIGGHDTKKMIVKVIIMALLINFSMFFTEVVIDSSNILALIFYNKINVGRKDANGNIIATTPYETVTGEKDVAGGLTGAFNPANQLTPDFFTAAANINNIPGQPPPTGPASTKPAIGIILGIMLLSGGVMAVAAYALFVSGFSFLGRLIELFVLIIFSPFALMSFSVPALEKVEYIGWHDWFKRLLTISFMAPIFMFFMYFIFMLVGANIFGGLLQTPSNGGPSFTLRVMEIFLPAMLILILLIKATDYAKKGSGKFGEVVMKGAQVVGGLALGAATGGTAMLASNTIGRAARNIANDDELRARAAAGDKGAQRKLAIANSLAKTSFDFRQTGIGKFAAKKSGMNLDSAAFGVVGMSTEKLKGGRAGRDEERVKKLEEKKKSYLLTKDAELKQNDRANQYKKDKDVAIESGEKAAAQYEENRKQTLDLARKNHEESIKKPTEDWERKYEESKVAALKANQESIAKGSNIKAFDENKFRADYEAGMAVSIGGRTVTPPPPPPKFDEKGFREAYAKENPPPPKFDEKGFREAYEEGGDLSKFGLASQVAAGNVRDAKGVNDDRKRAYGVSLANPTFKLDMHGNEIKDAEGKAIRKSFKDYRGLGKFTDYLKANLIEKTGILGENKEVVATVRKGETKEQHLLTALKHYTEAEHGAGDKKQEALNNLQKDLGGGQHGGTNAGSDNTPPTPPGQVEHGEHNH